MISQSAGDAGETETLSAEPISSLRGFSNLTSEQDPSPNIDPTSIVSVSSLILPKYSYLFLSNLYIYFTCLSVWEPVCLSDQNLKH